LFLGCECRCALEARGFYLFPRHEHFQQTSDANGQPVIARPVVDADTGQEIGIPTAFPGSLSGQTTVDYRTLLFGAEVNTRWARPLGAHVEWDTIFGGRYLRLDERLLIQDRLQPLQDNAVEFLGNPLNPPATLTRSDRFQCTNDFFGLQVGGQLRYRQDC